MTKLLTRDEFREAVFKRDGHQCVICKAPAVDAHHIIERRLFADSGYYIDNGSSLCASCHLAAEMTTLTPAEIQRACGITQHILPPHLYDDQDYDKWGNPILANGRRLKGELFEDSSVQKILAEGGALSLFDDRVKYPRTYHVPWSMGVTKDNRVNAAPQFGKEVVVTTKLDGENTTLYRDYLHARSVEYHPHPSRNWIKNFHSQIAPEIPEGYRICGENVYAKHSIEYTGLKSYFYVFSIWEGLTCLSWDDTVEWAQLLGLETVPVIYRGVYSESAIRPLYPEPRSETCEGYVIRTSEAFQYRDFRSKVGKFVRTRHVSPDTHHWRGKVVVRNELE